MNQLITTPTTDTRLAATGFYDGIDAEVYHGDLCIYPSLSSSGARTIVDTCEARFWAESYMNPDRESNDKEAFDIGKAAHLALLEPAEWADRVAIFHYKDWKTGASQKDKANARSVGLIPLLTKHAEKIIAMRAALVRDGHYGAWIKGSVKERTFVVIDHDQKVAFKARTDAIHMPDAAFKGAPGLVRVIDYKTTSEATPDQWMRRAADHGLERQQEFYERVIQAAIGRKVDEFIFLVQETQAPYLAKAYRLGPESLTYADTMNINAIQRFTASVSTGVWPGYDTGPGEVTEVDIPVWKRMSIEARKDAGDFNAPTAKNRLKAAVASGYAPINTNEE